MLQRVQNPNQWAYQFYGARGIDVDPRWLDFELFLADMGDKPDGLTLERVDNDRGYWPDNCVWDTRLAQSRNRRNNKLTYIIAEEIRQLYLTGNRVPDLARSYNVTPTHIRFILSRRIWDKP